MYDFTALRQAKFWWKLAHNSWSSNQCRCKNAKIGVIFGHKSFGCLCQVLWKYFHSETDPWYEIGREIQFKKIDLLETKPQKLGWIWKTWEEIHTFLGRIDFCSNKKLDKFGQFFDSRRWETGPEVCSRDFISQPGGPE